MKSLYFFILSFLIKLNLFAQDTLRISIEDAQKAFIDNNIQLVIQKFDIEASKAQIIQARLFANPIVNIEQGLITRKVISNDQLVGPYGQHAVQIQQLILLAGKRNKNIRLAQINEKISEYNFFDLLRTLNFSLKSNFFELAFQFKTIRVYQQEITTIERLVFAFRELEKNGNAALKDVVRLESSLFSLKSDLSQIELAIAQNQADLRILLGVQTNTFIIPTTNDQIIDSLNLDNQTLDNLINIAEENRYDIKAQQANVTFANTNLQLQRSLRVPDLFVGYLYDRENSYTYDYKALTFGSTLPFFNRNQGNIKIANYQLKSTEKALDQSRVLLHNDVIVAYTQTIKTENLYQNFDKDFVKNFNKLIQGVIQGYEKKTISLVEFMDFFDSYKQNVVQFNNLRNNRVQSYLKLNYSIAKEIFTF